MMLHVWQQKSSAAWSNLVWLVSYAGLNKEGDKVGIFAF